jgi:hypothetical protein
MPEVRSAVLARGRLIAAGNYIVVRGQPGLTLLVKQINVSQQVGPTTRINVYVQNGAGTILCDLLSMTLTLNQPQQLPTNVVLEETDQMLFTTDAAGTVNLWISGSVLHGTETVYTPPVIPTLLPV